VQAGPGVQLGAEGRQRGVEFRAGLRQGGRVGERARALLALRSLRGERGGHGGDLRVEVTRGGVAAEPLERLGAREVRHVAQAAREALVPVLEAVQRQAVDVVSRRVLRQREAIDVVAEVPRELRDHLEHVLVGGEGTGRISRGGAPRKQEEARQQRSEHTHAGLNSMRAAENLARSGCLR
jgi:hypothetical protein